MADCRVLSEKKASFTPKVDLVSSLAAGRLSIGRTLHLAGQRGGLSTGLGNEAFSSPISLAPAITPAASKPTSHTDVRQAPADQIMESVGSARKSRSAACSLSDTTGPVKSQSREEPQLDIEVDENMKRYITVVCGLERGRLYLEKFGKRKGTKSFEKCIVHKDKSVSPQEFELLAGKKTKAWRKSIKHHEKPLSKYITSRELLELELDPLDNMLLLSDPLDTSLLAPSMSSQTQPLSWPDSTDLFFQQLESQLMKALESTIKVAINSLKTSLEARMQHLVDELETLKTRVYKLESHTGEAVEVQPKGQEELTCIHSKLEAMAATMSSQQKVLEINEKANRVKNIIIVGLQEDQEKENIVEKVQCLFNNKLELEDIAIAKAKRLGQPRQNLQHNPRAVLVQLESLREKRKVMQNRSKLSGSRIFINHDLTQEQQRTDKNLREVRNKLRKMPEYAEKNITIYRGKLHVDRKPISDGVLENLSSSP